MFLNTNSKPRNIIKDARKHSCLFNNENNLFTYIERKQGESKEDRNNRAIMKGLLWLSEHLVTSSNITITFISESEQFIEELKGCMNGHSNIIISSTLQYFTSNYKDNNTIYGLYQSLVNTPDKENSNIDNNNNESNTKRSEVTGYEEYLSEDIIDAGIKSFNYYKGILNISSTNPDDAFIRLGGDSGDTQIVYSNHMVNAMGGALKDILIPGKTNRNRAIHGDTVAVQLLPENQWTSPSTVVKSEEEEDNDTLRVVNEATKLPTGRIVGIVRRNLRPYVCTIQIDKDKSINDMMTQESVLAVPMNSKIPKIRIKTRQIQELINSRIIVRIDDWDINSNYPSGHYVNQIGEIGLLNTEMEALLVENCITITPFSMNMLADIPDTNWQIPSEEIPKRRDMRKERIFSIDPLGSMDIDDALSVKYLSNGNLEIGVHIADVSWFVKKDSLLDVEARSRGTTVYLADRKFDMLPGILSEDLCSLREGVDRFAVSVLWEFEANTFKLKSTWYGRTIIRSCHALYYELAQRIFEDKCSSEEKAKLPDYDQLKKEISSLIHLARKIRIDRLDRGAVELESTEIRFELSNTKNPLNIIPKRGQEINRVVAEYMILANEAVAEKIYAHYPNCALLRNHGNPRGGKFDEVVKCAQARGFKIDTTSNKTFAESLNAAVIPEDPTFNFILRNLATMAMEEAQYISTGDYEVDEFYHYGLAASFYTHFTSPIRRYADVIVHRQLLAALQKPSLDPIIGPLELSNLCSHLNTKHRASKEAQRDSVDLFETLYFKDRNELHDAAIYGIRNNAILVFVPKFGIKGPVYLKDKNGELLIPSNAIDNNQVTGYSVDHNNHQVVLHTTTNKNMQLSLFDHLTIKINVQESRSHMASLKLELIHFGQDPSLVTKINTISTPDVVSKKDIQKTVKLEEDYKKSLTQRIPQAYLQDYTAFAQTKEDVSLYALIEGITNMSISSTNDAKLEKGAGDCVKLWKLKNGRPQKWQQTYSKYQEEEMLTEEELDAKRSIIEERNKDRKVQEDMSRLEQRLKYQATHSSRKKY